MELQTILIWVVVGAIAGAVLNGIIGGMRMGFIGALGIGILGAIISGLAFDYFGYQILGGIIIGTVLEALLGSIVLILIFGVFYKY
jgi:uncharacterized membrane protein YeaQ/YmgE (transglycosylase-associated protein family)